MRYLFCVVLIFFTYFSSFSQGTSCGTADPFCTGTSYTFPASTNVPSLGSIGCLYTTPNPAWYFFQIANNGPIDIYMSSTPNVDIDFICWGPFASMAAACASNLTANPGIDCSYSSLWNETCNIPNGITGEFYVLLITNYSNSVCNINFAQTSGTGTTNCGIVAPPIVGDTVCVGQPINLTVVNPTPGASYHWTGPNGYVSNTMSPVINNSTTNMSGTYSMTITLGGQTSPAVTCNVVVNPLPIASAGADQTICYNTSANLIATGGTTYLWNNSAGTNDSITVSPLVTTTYSVTVTNANGCTATDNVIVNVTPLPLANAGNDVSICFGDSTTLNATGGTAYLWDNGAGATASVVVHPTLTTTYIVTVTDNACTQTDNIVVTVNTNPIPVVKTVDATCELSNGTANASPIGLTYIWSNSMNTDNITGLIPGNYSVTVSDVNGCTGTASGVVVNIPSPTVSANEIDEICLRKDGSASCTPAGGSSSNYTYLWSNGETTQNIVGLYADTYSVTVSDGTCTATTSVIVRNIPGPIADFSINPSVFVIDENICFFNDFSVNAINWLWNFGDGGTSSDPSPNHDYQEVGGYMVTLIVQNNYGCADTTQHVVTVKDIFIFYLPNAFTPNGDGINEVFGPTGINFDIQSYNMNIYNRWGALVYTTNSLSQPWDGTNHNFGEKTEVIPGTYVYYVIIKDKENKEREYKGRVNVIR
ncbi:MAG: gliding motility-associated C-terminal domain-containing protein [Bacteroidetes bacterium]|nr:gliding motility-associated C-terminal domain-containing protein [Bacteroidota bacterium]